MCVFGGDLNRGISVCVGGGLYFNTLIDLKRFQVIFNLVDNIPISVQYNLNIIILYHYLHLGPLISCRIVPESIAYTCRQINSCSTALQFFNLVMKCSLDQLDTVKLALF